MQSVITKINIEEKFRHIGEFWDPHIAAELNGQYLKLAKFKGLFPWHKHDNEDELFMVIKGSFIMELEDKQIKLFQGEILIIPKGTLHRPVAIEEVHVLVFEPISTMNTGDQVNSLTKYELKRI